MDKGLEIGSRFGGLRPSEIARGDQSVQGSNA